MKENGRFDPPQDVRHRRVFYIPGYDPVHPRRYRELYRKEGAEQARISGYDISQKASGGEGSFGWKVSTLMGGARTLTEVEVLLWSDIVRESMDKGIAAAYLNLVRTAWIYISTGTLRRLMWLRKGPVIAALYPVAMLLGQALLGLVLGWIAGAALERLMAAILPGWGLLELLTRFLGWAVTLGVMGGVMHWFWKNDNRFYAYYLMNDYAHAARLRGDWPPELEPRLAEFAARVAKAMDSGADEVLVVGHSSGAHLAVAVLAQVLRQRPAAKGDPALSFLSLGQVIPMVSFLPRAGRLRADLHYLSEHDGLTWVDVSAPGDGCCFALCDPVAVSGVAGPDQRWPLVLSAAFSQTLAPETFAQLKRRYFRLHFQYLCAFDKPEGYDYFQITAGPLSLSRRFAGRAPSRSRIDVAASKFTSVS